MEQGKDSNDNQTMAYNVRALIKCEATYLGAAIPMKTTQPPGIIHEPLEKICEKETLPSLVNTPKKPVRLFVFHSGIVIQILFGKHNGELVWYPIQNLYCSASLQPLKTKHGTVEFRTLEDKAGSKSSLKPIFALVIRETIKKKVLQCHAFAVARKEVAQLLVQATAIAYREKKGWDHPLSSVHFGSTKYSYTLNIADELHPDSGYSDHEESSVKSAQSPQSSELSIGSVGEKPPPPDNQMTSDSKSHSSENTPTLTSTNKTLNRTYYSSQTSPTSSASSATYNGFQSELVSRNSGNEQRSPTRSTKSTSMSSGYPLSRDSSLLTASHPLMSPRVVVVQEVHPPHPVTRHSKHTSYGNYLSTDNLHKIKSKEDSFVPYKSFSSLSLEQSTTGSQSRRDNKIRKTKTIPKVEIINVDGVPRRVIHYETHYAAPSNGVYSNGRASPHCNEPIYVQHHPEHFMYEGEGYRGSPGSSRTRECYKELKKKSSGTIKDTRAGYPTIRKLDDNRHLSMEGRLTKKSIPRQLL